jgi:hypothetical protein
VATPAFLKFVLYMVAITSYPLDGRQPCRTVTRTLQP